nr:hypothetical protein [Tanacetum cinerariifolium]
MNQNFFEPNPCYEPKSSSFDQFQTQQFLDVHQPSKEISIDELKIMMQSYCERMNQQREQEALLAAQREQELREQEQAAQEKEEPPQNFDFQLYRMHNDVKDLIKSALNFKLLSINLKFQRLDKEKQEVKNIVEQPTKRRTRITESLQNFKVVHRMSSISNTSQISSVIAIAPVLPTEKPEYSLSMGDEQLSTISETESDEVIKSSVENFVPILSETEVTSDNEITSNEDVLMIYSNSLFDDEEILLTKIDPHYFNTESNIIESLLNQDTLIDSSPKFDYLLEEYSGKLAHIDPIPSGIKEADFDLEEEIRLVENLLYDNSSPRTLEELNVEITDTIVESFSPSPIPVEDSDSQMEEVDLFLATDDLMPPNIENDDYDSKEDIHFLEELLSSDPLSLPKIESSNFDHHNNPSFPRPPPEPPDVEICFNFEPHTGVLTAKVVKGISKHYVFMPNILPTFPTLCPNFDTLLPFSFKNEDKVFKPGILSYLLVSHREKIISDFFENPMMMYGGNILHLDVLFLHFNPP